MDMQRTHAHLNPIHLQKYLGGLEYPVSKQKLIEHAREQGAPEDVVAALAETTVVEYETPADLIHGLSETT